MSDSIDHLRNELRTSGRRFTRQRRLILEILEKSDEHLDAEMLYAQVRLHDPEVSLATVYRTLAMFKELGLVEEHSLGEEHAHYEAVRDKPHYHFVCLECGKVIEFIAPQIVQVGREVEKREGVVVTTIHLRLSGYCADCREQREENG